MSLIKWDVKEVRLDKELGKCCELTAILKGSTPLGVCADDVVRIHKNLYNQLNPTVDSLYPRTLTPQEFYYFMLNTEFTVDKADRILSVVRPGIKKVVFNAPATIVFWMDGSKTVVKAQNNETFDPEKGLAMAIAKKTMGNKGNYYKSIKKWVDEYYECTKRVHDFVESLKAKCDT